MNTSSITEKLLSLLVNLYSLALKTQNYHWNITGPNFYEVHTLLGKQYNQFVKTIDSLAEHIRTYGIKIPANFKAFSKLNKLPEPDENLDYKSMMRHLLEDNKALFQMLVDCIKIAEVNSNYTTVDLLSDMLLIHEKNIWVLDCTLG